MSLNKLLQEDPVYGVLSIVKEVFEGIVFTYGRIARTLLHE